MVTSKLPNSLYRVPSVYLFWHAYFVILVPFSLSFLFVSVFFFFCPAYHVVPDWQPRILLGMVEARSVNVKKIKIFPLTGGCSEGLGAF